MPTFITAIRVLFFGLLILSLIACSEPAPVVSADAQTSITLIEGEATWRHNSDRSETALDGNIGANWDDEISTPVEGNAVLQLDDQTTIEMGPDTVISISRPYPTESRPVIRLLFGSIQVTTQSASYRFDSFREIPIAFRIVNANIMLDPIDTPAKFNLRFEDDTAKIDVFTGVVDASAGLVHGELSAEWRAELVPDEPLRIIPPWTPTPRLTATFTATFTPTPSNTPTKTNTPTPTNTRRPATATFTPTNTEPSPPTQPPASSTPAPQPKPTKAPTDVPPPTDPPQPTATEPRPTPGG